MTEQITDEAVIKFLRDYYQAIHCMKHHQERLASRIIQQAIEVLDNGKLEELANCDCYECRA
jgi:hypothetical protein